MLSRFFFAVPIEWDLMENVPLIVYHPPLLHSCILSHSAGASDALQMYLHTFICSVIVPSVSVRYYLVGDMEAKCAFYDNTGNYIFEICVKYGFIVEKKCFFMGGLFR